VEYYEFDFNKNSRNEKHCLVLAFVIIIFFVFLCVNV
jgi:hypothetical protein